MVLNCAQIVVFDGLTSGRILGYTGRVKFPEGLERTIAWYKQSL